MENIEIRELEIPKIIKSFEIESVFDVKIRVDIQEKESAYLVFATDITDDNVKPIYCMRKLPKEHFTLGRVLEEIKEQGERMVNYIRNVVNEDMIDLKTIQETSAELKSGNTDSLRFGKDGFEIYIEDKKSLRTGLDFFGEVLRTVASANKFTYQISENGNITYTLCKGNEILERVELYTSNESGSIAENGCYCFTYHFKYHNSFYLFYVATITEMNCKNAIHDYIHKLIGETSRMNVSGINNKKSKPNCTLKGSSKRLDNIVSFPGK